MSEFASVAARAQRLYVGLAVLVAAIWLALLPLRPLFNPDEGRYAEIPREMLASGDWIIPHLDGLAYIEKPPLQYWATALSFKLLGLTVFAARLYVALCALGTVGSAGFAAYQGWGRAAAWRAAAVLASMLLFVVLGQLLTLDMSLCFYMTLSLVAFLQAQREPSARRWMLLAWTATALGVLTKGLVAAAIPLAVLVLHTAYTRDLGPWRRASIAWGLPLFLAITVPWHWLAARRLADFLQFFFVHEHLARYLTPSADREQPWWFFIGVMAVGTLPWSLSALRALATGWRRGPSSGPFDATVFLWIWVIFVVGFFSVSDSKLIPYVLPALPALALLVVAVPETVWQRDVSVTAVIALVVALVLLGAAVFGPRYLPATARGECFALLLASLPEIAALLGVTGVCVLVSRRRDPTRATMLLGVGWCVAVLLIARAAAAVAPIYSGATIARAAGALPPSTPLYTLQSYDQTLPFYWRRTVELVSYRGELDYGLRHDPSAEIGDLAKFVAQWQELPQGYALMENSMYEKLDASKVPMREIAHDVNRVLVARR